MYLKVFEIFVLFHFFNIIPDNFNRLLKTSMNVHAIIELDFTFIIFAIFKF